MKEGNGLNQIWALDFMHDRLYDGSRFRALNVIDEGKREALRIEVAYLFFLADSFARWSS